MSIVMKNAPTPQQTLPFVRTRIPRVQLGAKFGDGASTPLGKAFMFFFSDKKNTHRFGSIGFENHHPTCIANRGRTRGFDDVLQQA